MVPTKPTFISNTALAPSTAPIPASGATSLSLSENFPVGNQIMKRLNLRYSGALSLTESAAGTVIAGGGLQNIRGLTLQTPQHGVIFNNIDGQGLSDLQFLTRQVRPFASDISSAATGTPSFSYRIPLDFRDPSALFPDATGLDMIQVQAVQLTITIGGATDFISGGTYSVEEITPLNLELDADTDPAPDPASIPSLMRYVNLLRTPINQTQAQFQIKLPYGNRLIKRYLVEQVNSSTFARLANTIVGVNDQDRISFAVGGVDWFHRIEWLALQERMQDDYGISAPLTGAAVVGWDHRDAVGHNPAQYMGLNNPEAGSPIVEIDVDVTSVTNGSIWTYEDGVMPIPVSAQRPAPAVAKVP